MTWLGRTGNTWVGSTWREYSNDCSEITQSTFLGHSSENSTHVNKYYNIHNRTCALTAEDKLILEEGVHLAHICYCSLRSPYAQPHLHEKDSAYIRLNMQSRLLCKWHNRARCHSLPRSTHKQGHTSHTINVALMITPCGENGFIQRNFHYLGIIPHELHKRELNEVSMGWQ